LVSCTWQSLASKLEGWALGLGGCVDRRLPRSSAGGSEESLGFLASCLALDFENCSAYYLSVEAIFDVFLALPSHFHRICE